MTQLLKRINLDHITPLILLGGLSILPWIYYHDYVVHLIILSLMYAVISITWTLLGLTGAVSLGHSAYFGLGAYFTIFSLKYWGLVSYLAIPIAILISSAVAIMIGYITFRFGIAGIYFALTTIAFAEILRELFIYYREFTGGSLGVFVSPISSIGYFFYDSKIPYYYTLIILLLILYIYLMFSRQASKFLKILSAIGEDISTAASIGINILKYRLYAFLWGAIFTSLMGWFYVHYLRYVTPDVGFGLGLSVYVALLSIVANLRLPYILIASLILTPVGEVLRAVVGYQFAGLDVLVYGLLLMILVVVRALRKR